MNTYINKSQFLFIIFSLSLLGSPTCFGQEEAFQKHELSLVGGLSFSGLSLELKQGKTFQKSSPILGVDYTYFLNGSWGLSIGAEYQKYSAAASLENLTGAYDTVDNEGESFEFRYSTQKFNQQYDIQMLGVPITVQYQTSGTTKWYVRAGGKIGIPIKAEYQTQVYSLSTSGYYPQYDAELFDPAFMGFGEYGQLEAPEQEMDSQIAFSAILETGIIQPIGKNRVYIGLFVDYGINNISDTNAQQEQLIEYQTEQPDSFAYPNLFETPLAEEIKPRAFGLKLRFGF